MCSWAVLDALHLIYRCRVGPITHPFVMQMTAGADFDVRMPKRLPSGWHGLERSIGAALKHTAAIDVALAVMPTSVVSMAGS